MGDVIQYLIDGTSGIVTGGVDGKALVAGVCSKGIVGKAYLIGKRTNLEELLGTGPLVDRIRDMLVTGGQEPYVVAVPVQGQPGGYISALTVTEGKTGATVSGYPALNADVVVRVATPGAVGTATLEICTDGGKTFAEAAPSAVQNPVSSGEDPTGATLVFAEGATLETGATYSFAVRCPVGPVYRVGDAESPLVEVEELASGVLDGAELVIQIVKGGDRNEGTFQLSVDGGDSFTTIRTIPVDGLHELADYGVKLSFPSGDYVAGTTYTCRLLPPSWMCWRPWRNRCPCMTWSSCISSVRRIPWTGRRPRPRRTTSGTGRNPPTSKWRRVCPRTGRTSPPIPPLCWRKGRTWPVVL